MKFSDSLMICSACQIWKSTQRPHAKNTSHDWVTEPLQVVTTGLMGPISPAASGNNINYIAKFTDVYSRFSVVYFLNNKSSSSVLDSFIKFERDLAIPFGRRVQYLLRSDQGTAYTSRNFKEYCKRTGVIQQFTALYTPQQNGIPERRAGRTVIMDLPKRLWGELASTAVFLKNRIPHCALGSDTPYYRMFGENADLSFLRVIGSRAFVHEEGHRDKLDQRAREGVLVGYNSDSPTYRIFASTNQRQDSELS